MASGSDFTAAKIRKCLAGPPLPILLRHVWFWFCELSGSRSSGMAANPISYTEIEAWGRLTGRRPDVREVRLIVMLDSVWRSVHGEDEKTEIKDLEWAQAAAYVDAAKTNARWG